MPQGTTLVFFSIFISASVLLKAALTTYIIIRLLVAQVSSLRITVFLSSVTELYSSDSIVSLNTLVTFSLLTGTITISDINDSESLGETDALLALGDVDGLSPLYSDSIVDAWAFLFLDALHGSVIILEDVSMSTCASCSALR
jgi:hypothetical protein